MTKASVQMPKTLTYCYEIAVAGFIKCSTIKRLITSHLSFARIGAGLEGKKNLSFYLVSYCLFVVVVFFLFFLLIRLRWQGHPTTVSSKIR